jgi:hypothetical protein
MFPACFSLRRHAVTHLSLDFTEYQKWRQKVKTWTRVCKGTDLECSVCGETGEYFTFESPDKILTVVWAYDICPICAMKIGLIY